MANIKVTFVLPNDVQDETEATAVMKQAYNSCKELVEDTLWDKESNLVNRDLSKKDYLVFEELEDKDFSKYLERQCAIIGPIALNDCLMKCISIPNFPWPILTVTMFECEVTCTQMPKSRKEIIKNKVQLMGGLYCGDLRDSTTHLICDTTNSGKYVLAAEKGALLMLPSWIDHMFEVCRNSTVSCHDEKILNKYKCRTFHNLTICATGLSSSKEKAKLVELINDNGGNFTGMLVISKTDILVCYGIASTSSDKYKAARRSKRISCVTPDWIHDSIEKGYALPHDLEKYRVKAATSTPTKDGEKIDPNFSTISALGQSICQKSHIDETVTSNSSVTKRQSYKRKAEDLVEKLDIKKVKSARHFLDGCSVFITGFNPTCHEKLNKIINISGATRYDEFSDRVTHVIVGDPTCNELIDIRENCGQCYLLTVDWLLDSVDQQKPADECKYFLTNSDGSAESNRTNACEPGRVLSEQVMSILKEHETSKHKSDSVTVAPRKDDELTQKYLKMADTNKDDEDTLAKMLANQSAFQKKEPENFQIKSRTLHNKPQINNQSLTFMPPNTSTQISEASTDISESELVIFENLTFRLEGFNEEIDREKRNHIASAGGTVVDGCFKGICNYAIVPIIYNPSELLPALEIVNDLWLNENLEERALITDIQYFHRHITLPSTDVLNGCVITISGYTNFEREFLQTVIMGLGGIFQEQFSKKTNAAKNVMGSTHLISPEASGRKYEAALRWNLPVTTKDWLLACAKTGKRLPLENYLIGESRISNNETLNTTMTTNTIVQKSKTPEKDDSNDAPESPANFIQKHLDPCSQVTPIKKILQDAINSKVLPTPPTPKQYYPWDPKTPDTPIGAFIRPNPSPGLRKELQKYVNSFPDFEPSKRRVSTPLSELKKRLWDKAAEFSTSVDKVSPIFNFRIANTYVCSPSMWSNDSDSDYENLPKEYRLNIRKDFPSVTDKEFKEMFRLSRYQVPSHYRNHFRGRGYIRRGEYGKSSQSTEVSILQNQPDTQTSLSDSINKPTKEMQSNVENIELHQKLKKLQQMVTGSANNTPKRISHGKIDSSSLEFPGIEVQSQACTVSWDYEEEKVDDPKKKIFLFSGIEDRERLTGLIEVLGGQAINSSQYVPSATHLICLKPARNEKTLSCMAAGKWILHESYLEKSAEIGKFLNEESFEFGNPKAKKNTFYEKKDNCICVWRKDIGLRGYGAFHDMRAIIMADKKDILSNIIQAGGGVVVNVEPPFNDSVHATHCLIELKTIKDLSIFIPLAKQGIKCVSTIYVNDFLWKTNQNDLDSIIPYFSKYYS